MGVVLGSRCIQQDSSVCRTQKLNVTGVCKQGLYWSKICKGFRNGRSLVFGNEIEDSKLSVLPPLIFCLASFLKRIFLCVDKRGSKWYKLIFSKLIHLSGKRYSAPPHHQASIFELILRKDFYWSNLDLLPAITVGPEMGYDDWNVDLPLPYAGEDSGYQGRENEFSGKGCWPHVCSRPAGEPPQVFLAKEGSIAISGWRQHSSRNNRIF